MIPDWFAAIENALIVLKTGRILGAVDFFVSRNHPPANSRRLSWLSRLFWPTWFASDNVFLSPDHLPFLRNQCEQLSCAESFARLPYLPGLCAPYYTFMGRLQK
jgi:S-adenosylmethionine-diacylgycerolhomoserine-N-methlytransferase